jgi:hypothetical protein
MQVFVVSYQLEDAPDLLDTRIDQDLVWHLQAVCSSAKKANAERDSLFRSGVFAVKIEQLELDGKSIDPIVVYIYDIPDDLITDRVH